MEFERIFTETPKTAIWDRLEILTTINGAKKQLITSAIQKQIEVSEELLLEKARGVAFCIRSAKDLFKISDSKNLTPSLTSLYYGTYNLLSALMIGDVENELTLSNIENFSKNGGHGLKSIYNDNSQSLHDNEFIYGCNNGFYKELLIHFKYDVDEVVMSKNYKKIEEIPDGEKNKLFSLNDLLSRIPEVKNIFVEIFKTQPNYISHSFQKLYGENKGFYKMHISENSNTDYLKAGDINDILNFPEEFNFEYKKETPESILKEEYWHEKLPEELVSSLKVYHSAIAKDCTIKPLITIDEPILIYFKLLYILSIWTRYRPNLWREVSEGKHDEYRSLLGIFTDATERVIPNEFLNKFYGRKFVFASHSYWS